MGEWPGEGLCSTYFCERTSYPFRQFLNAWSCLFFLFGGLFIIAGRPRQDEREKKIQSRWTETCHDLNKLVEISKTGGPHFSYVRMVYAVLVSLVGLLSWWPHSSCAALGNFL